MKILFLLLISFSAHAKYTSEKMKFDVEKIVTREDVIWGFDFFPDGRVIFTERGGKMGIFDPKTKTTTMLKNLPAIYAAGQGGLLDVRVHTDGTIYFTYSEPVEKTKSTLALAKAQVKGDSLVDVKKLFTGVKPNSHDHHYGSRIIFDGKGHIFFSMGDRGQQEKAQEIENHQGTIMRIKEDGSIPKDNPFEGAKNAKGEIWSYGHRSPQGLVMKPGTDEIWEAEMGPRGGDEINVIEYP